MRTWEQALIEHKEELKKYEFYPDLLGIFTYGSQNYGIATETSDWDTIAIVVPSFEDLVLKTPISQEVHLSNGEHIVVKDIREVIKMFKKQNINFLEILFTEYYWIDSLYAPIWHMFLQSFREEIAHYDMNIAIQSICGQALHTLHQDPTDGKKVANTYRLMRFLEKYLNFNSSYKDSITVPIEEREFLIKMKETGKVLIDIEQIELKLNHLKSFRFPIDNIVHKKKVEQILETAILHIVKARFDNEELLYNLERE